MIKRRAGGQHGSACTARVVNGDAFGGGADGVVVARREDLDDVATTATISLNDGWKTSCLCGGGGFDYLAR